MIPRRAFLAAAGAGLALAWAPRSEAGGLSPIERRRLLDGELVRRDVDYDSGDGSYFGGVSYAKVDAPPAEVMGVLLDVRSYRSILPLTLEVREVGGKGDVRFIFLRQGGRLGSAAYTLLVRRQSPSTIRFWLDASRPHDIEDCWGYFRVDPLGASQSVVTYAALLRLESGMVKLLFSEKIRSFALQTPLYIRRYVEGRGR